MEVTRGFICQILHAMVQLSDAGVIHCDLKPENILLAGYVRTRPSDTQTDVVWTSSGVR